MKYSSKALWTAIEILIPSVEVARTKGKTFSLPEMLKTAAVEAFIESETTEFKINYSKLVAANVVRVAIKELCDHGMMVFGECDEIFK